MSTACSNSPSPSPPVVPDTRDDLYFGSNGARAISGAPDYPFLGTLDEISFFNRALSSDEVSAIYSAGETGKCPPEANDPPLVHAGMDLIAETNVPLLLSGIVTDDGLPAEGTLTTQWRLLNGPDEVEFIDRSSPQTFAIFPEPGFYVLELWATDGQMERHDVVEVRADMPCFVQEQTLTAWWPGNGLPTEVIQGADALLASGTAYDTGRVALGYSFDGADDSIRVPKSQVTDLGLNPAFTIEFWVKPGRVADSALLTWHTGLWSGERTRIWQSDSGHRVHVWLRSTAGQFLDLQSQEDVMDALTWRHVAVTFDSVAARARLYIDGVLKHTVAVPAGFVPDTTDDLYFGSNGARDYPFLGTLDEISFYSRALSSSDVYSIYQSGAVGKCPADSNERPSVDAGPDLPAQVEVPAALLGSVTDDGLPIEGRLRSRWTVRCGMASAVEFLDAASPETSATFHQPGIYLLELWATDGQAESRDTVEMRVGMPCSFKDSALVAWWPANGDARDMARDNDAIPASGTTFTQAKVSMGFSFDGTNDSVRVPTTTTLDLGRNTAFTIEFWVKPGRVADSALLTWHNGFWAGERTRIWQSGAGHKIYTWLRSTAGQDLELQSQDNVMDALTWRHVAVTFDSVAARARLYIDGMLMHTVTVPAGFVPDTRDDLYFGSNGARDYPFLGMLDEISLFNRALTPEEVAMIYASGETGKCPSNSNQPPVVEAGLPIQLAAVTDTASLLGQADDDSLPVGILETLWSKRLGPGSIAFADPASLQTTATFSAPGYYRLDLMATDLEIASTDTLALSVAMPSCPPDTVCWWPGDYSPNDLVGGNNLTLQNGATYRNAYVGTGAFQLDGVDDMAFMPASPTVASQTTNGFTMEGWIYPTASGLPDCPLLEWNSGSASGGSLWIYPAGGRLKGHVANSSGGEEGYASTGPLLQINTWQHIALSFDPATRNLCFYLNGQPVGSFTTSAGSSIRTSYAFYLGQRPGDGRKFAGGMDEVCLYGRVLPLPEIQWIYSSGAAGRCITPGPNKAPYVNAGGDDQSWLPSPAQLRGVVIDDRLPQGADLATSWTQISGPASATIADPLSPKTSATLTIDGLYEFELAACDSQYLTTDTVAILVHPKPNERPVVNAGSDTTVLYPGGAQLEGTAIDDGLPEGAALTTNWSQVSGPAASTIANPTSLQSAVTFAAPGTYVFQLTANDTELSDSDLVTVRVQSRPRVSLSAPAPRTLFASGQSITAAAQPADDDGQIVRVEFLADGAVCATATAPPWNASLCAIVRRTPHTDRQRY